MNYDLWGRRGMRPKLWSTGRGAQGALRHGASCRGRRHYTLARPRRCGATAWWWWSGSWRRKGPLGARQTATTGDRPFRPKAGAAASASPGATAGRGHASLRLAATARDAPVLRCPDAGNRVPQPFTGAWDRGLGCRRQQILVIPAASATLSVTHVREEPSNHWAL